jgi:hypothetical protein
LGINLSLFLRNQKNLNVIKISLYCPEIDRDLDVSSPNPNGLLEFKHQKLPFVFLMQFPQENKLNLKA